MRYIFFIAIVLGVCTSAFSKRHPQPKSRQKVFVVEDSVISAITRLRDAGMWRTPIKDMWDDAMARAQKSHRPVLAFNVDYVDSASIGFRDRILQDPNVLVYLFENFEIGVNNYAVDPPPSVGFDSLNHLGKRLDGLEKGYSIAVRPTAILIRPDSQEIERIPYPNLMTGFEFINRIRDFLTGKNTVQSLREQFWRDTNNFIVRTAYLRRLTERAEYDSVVYQLGVIAQLKDHPDESGNAAKQFAYLKMNVEGKSDYLKQWVRSLPKNPDDSLQALQGLNDLLEFYQVRKKIDSIAVCYNNIFAFTGTRDPETLNNFAWDLANYSKRWNEALDLSNEAIRARPSSADFYDTRALIYWSLKQYEDAVHSAESSFRFAKSKDDKKYFKERLQFYKKQLSESRKTTGDSHTNK
ncbi:MAG TPA: tetratricopeptide repeat protein [Candidatus Kapabacteria bacterium]|nr:tetratricopeptide repeat protein [Candidatus Kapabacteria bacterium]